MGPVDNFIHSLNTILKSDTADKTSQIAAVMSRCEEVFKGYQAAPKAQELRELADRIAPISSQDAETIRSYADGIFFPKELTLRLIKEMGQGLSLPEFMKKLGNVRLASKEMQQMVLQSLPQGPLKSMGVNTAEGAIQFAELFGPDLTYLDISEISFGHLEMSKLMSHLPNLKTLIAQNCKLYGGGAQAIADSPTAASLKKIDLWGNDIRALTIAASPYLKNLEALSLGANLLFETAAREIASAFPNLKSLDLSYNGISSAGVSFLAPLSSLRSLDLSGNQIGEAGVRALAPFSHLQALRLYACDIEEAGIMALTEIFTQLKELNLGGNRVGEKEIEALAKHCEMLEALDLGNNVSEAILRAVATFKNLRTLTFNDCNIHIQSLAPLANLTNLERLEIDRSKIGDEGAALIAATFSNLRELRLGANEIADRGALALSSLPNLQILDLSGNASIGDAAMGVLINAQKNLKTLKLYGNIIGEKGAIAIATSQIPNINFDQFGEFAEFAVSQRPRILPLTQEQRQQLYRNICEIAREGGVAVDGPEEEWGKAHLFEDRERFERAYREV